MCYTINLVEDEKSLNQILTAYLKKEGWHVQSFNNGEDARKAILTEPHLWILDIMLPDIDGYQLLKEIKAQNELTPVIFISARDEDLDRILGLEMGSDDYLAKPFLPKELVIRAKKLLSRVYGKISNGSIHYGRYLINEEKRTIEDQDEEIVLSSKEFDLLLLFTKHIGQAFSREELLGLIWGEDYFGSDRVVDDLVRRVRKKVPGLRVEAIYGYGYRTVEAE